MARGEDTGSHPGRQVGRDAHAVRTQAGPLAAKGQVGSYLGGVGGVHMFSAEATGGGETDSHAVSIHPDHAKNLVPGERYAVHPGENGFHRAVPYNDNRHGDMLGAPISETNRADRTLPGQAPDAGRVKTTELGGHTGGAVGFLVGHDGENAHFSAEATGGGSTDSLQFAHKAGRSGQDIVRDNAGKRMAAVPTGNGGYNLHAYNPQAHGNLPGAPQEDQY